jgi:hypothetical protein
VGRAYSNITVKGDKHMIKKLTIVFMIVSLFVMVPLVFAADDVQKQIEDIKNVLPKFAIPMREVGDRFQNMYFAAKGGNWALAAYMSKYMNGSMNPAQLTKPDEYKIWKDFYENTFAPVNKAISDQNFPAFDKEYNKVIPACNGCHSGMGYGFIRFEKRKAPAGNNISYTVKSKAIDVPK